MVDGGKIQGGMYSGSIELWRRLLYHPIWLDEKFTRGQAWVDLLLLTFPQAGQIMVRGARRKVSRFCCPVPTAALAKRWRWSRGKTKNHLGWLEARGFIKTEAASSNIGSQVRIYNYDEYCGKESALCRSLLEACCPSFCGKCDCYRPGIDKEKIWCVRIKRSVLENRKKGRSGPDYDQWRYAVFSKDKWTCQRCEKVGGRLNAHHILSWKGYPALRLVVENGLTLCETCHKTVHYG